MHLAQLLHSLYRDCYNTLLVHTYQLSRFLIQFLCPLTVWLSELHIYTYTYTSLCTRSRISTVSAGQTHPTPWSPPRSLSRNCKIIRNTVLVQSRAMGIQQRVAIVVTANTIRSLPNAAVGEDYTRALAEVWQTPKIDNRYRGFAHSRSNPSPPTSILDGKAVLLVWISVLAQWYRRLSLVCTVRGLTGLIYSGGNQFSTHSKKKRR
jgi:hypothetical protein